MGMSGDIQISVTNLAVISKSLDFSNLFTTAPATMSQINRIENRTMMPMCYLTPYSQEDESRVRRVPLFNAKLSRQKPGHIYAIRPIMPRLMVAANNRKHLVRDRLDKIHHRCQFFHRREVSITIAKAGLQSAIEKIPSQHAVRIVMRVNIIDVLADSIVIRMRVGVVIVCKDE